MHHFKTCVFISKMLLMWSSLTLVMCKILQTPQTLNTARLLLDLLTLYLSCIIIFNFIVQFLNMHCKIKIEWGRWSVVNVYSTRRLLNKLNKKNNSQDFVCFLYRCSKCGICRNRLFIMFPLNMYNCQLFFKKSLNW